MPELPEVETVRRYLEPRLRGARIETLTLRRPDLRWPMPAEALARAEGATVRAVRRRGKYLLLDLDTTAPDAPAALLVHLGMSGRLFLDASDGAPDAPYLRHEHWRARVRSGPDTLALRYEDARRFGMLDVVARTDDSHPLLDRLGLEPLDDAFCAAWLFAQTRNLRGSVKATLMDAHRLVGVGNIYASEACWRARVNPYGAAGGLSRAACGRLADAVRAVLQDAIADGGTSLRDFVSGDRNPGYFQQRLDVYDRAGADCNRCGEGAPIERGVLLGRATYRCPRCQRRPISSFP